VVTAPHSCQGPMRLICVIAFASNLWTVLADEGTLNRSVKAEPVYLKVIGTFDPMLHDLFFISSLQSLFDDYCQLHVASVIYGFDLAAMFLTEKTHYDYNGQNGAIAITSWCEIQTTFRLPRDADPNLFSSKNASSLVMNFCSGSDIYQLKNDLDEIDNVTVINITAFPAGSKEVHLLLNDQSIPNTVATTGGEESKSLIAIAYVSLAIILCAMTALVVSSLRRRCLFGKIEYDNSSDIPRGPSADNLRTKHAICQASDCENESHTSSSNQINYNDLESFMVVSNCETSVIALECGNDDSAIGDVDPSGRKEIYAAETFDDDETATSRTDLYPEYQCNSSLPSNSVSPAWSMDSFSQNTSPYSAQTEGLSKRRRWHDEVNDLNLLSLPESFRTSSSTYHSSTSSNGTIKS
jgi:hypothetical protein